MSELYIRNEVLERQIIPKIPSYVKSILSENVWLCGGALRDITAKNWNLKFAKKPRDYDIFFKTGYKIPKEWLDIWDEQQDIFANHNIQLITWKQFDNIAQVLSEFNYTINCIGTDGKHIYTHNDFGYHLYRARLKLVKINNPASFLMKQQKYINYGYRMTYQDSMEFMMRLKLGDHGDISAFDDYKQ